MRTAGSGALDTELAHLDDLGLLMNREAAEHVFRLIGALAALRSAHDVDASGRCKRCRPTRWWHRRHACTVSEAFDDYRIGQTGTSN